MKFFSLGFLLHYLLPQKRSRLPTILIIILGIACSLELMQGWILGRYPDIPDILGSLAGALFVPELTYSFLI